MFYYMHIMATESGRNKTSILAVSFALMNVGRIIPGMLSGFVQGVVGYTGLFIVSSTVGLTALLLIARLPVETGLLLRNVCFSKANRLSSTAEDAECAQRHI